MSERQGDLSDVLANTTGAPVTIYDPDSTSPGAPYSRTAFGGNAIPANGLNPVTQKVFGVTPVAGLAPLAEPNIPDAQVWNGQPNYVPASSKATTDNKLYTTKVDQLFGPNRLAARYTYTDNKQLSPEYYAPTEPDQAEYGGHNGSLTFTQVVSPRRDQRGAHWRPVRQPCPQRPGADSRRLVAAGIAHLPDQPVLAAVLLRQLWVFAGRILDRHRSRQSQGLPGSDDVCSRTSSPTPRGTIRWCSDSITTTIASRPMKLDSPAAITTSQVSITAVQDAIATGRHSSLKYDLGLADFLLGDVAQLSVNVYPVYHTRQSAYDAYAQDDWRVSARSSP